MQTIRVVQKTAADGTLSLHIPLDNPEMEYEVVVIITPRHEEVVPQGRDWPHGYFELAGSIDDDTFCRHPQGELPRAVGLD